MDRKEPETSEWIDRAQKGDKLFSYANINGVHIVSAVRDRDLRIQDEIKGEGHAWWRVINESTARKRRMILRATVRSGKAVWERARPDSSCSGEIEVEVEVSRSDSQDYSEKFIAKGEGEEAIITRCQKYPQTLTSGFIIRPTTHPPPIASTLSHSSAIRIFISYSHKDSKYLKKDSLLGFLSGLEHEGFEFWYDERINAGELWDERIKEEIDRADIVLVLVSQWFLNSPYCKNIEVKRFLERQTDRGLKIFPVILSPCAWNRHQWLSVTQFEPREGKSIARHYKDEGSRDELYLRIFQQLLEIGREIRK